MSGGWFGLLHTFPVLPGIFLVGGWTNPIAKTCACQNGFIFPNFRGENKTYLETTTYSNITYTPEV